LNEVSFAFQYFYYGHHKEEENKVVLYTDNILFFKSKLPQSVTYISLDKELIQNKGSINFRPIMKIELLKRFANRFSGNVLYLDSDTPTSRTNISTLSASRLSCCRLFKGRRYKLRLPGT
jgi:hypothetical protein